MKIIEYNVLTKPRPSDVVEAVERLISTGWQPYGQLFFSQCRDNPNDYSWVQAMVKYATDKE